MKAMDVAATNDMQSPISDPDCGRNDSGGMACFALCASAVAILPASIALPMMMAMTQPLSHGEQFMASRESAKDLAPYPALPYAGIPDTFDLRHRTGTISLFKT
jgi:hypothetical protein